MSTIRVLVRSRSQAGRLILSLLAAIGVIVGLLAMHTISSQGPAHGHSTEASTGQQVEESSIGAVPVWAAIDAEPCGDSCASPSHGPDHSMLMVTCVLALLVVLIVLAPPSMLAKLASALALWRRYAIVLGRVARPRPPSLSLLSISRT
ncbi:DUF6153 family protein [Agromyces sp. H66]|uniref:DUF6153 family protein n=1 Tax=Agromyces sp. H66 TaxID=2529859 RepID=UPI0010AAA988|nr:DUF6153 family protein [Agromyces sp. H66]